jgi:hypothetical protein
MSAAYDEKYAKECVRLEPTALEEEFVRYTADLAYWGERLAEAKRTEALDKLQRDVVAADLDVAAREALAGDKKPTEAAVSAWVQKHPAMLESEKNLIECGFHVDRVRATYDALRAKRDMLVGLGAQQRAELQGEPTIRAATFD